LLFKQLAPEIQTDLGLRMTHSDEGRFVEIRGTIAARNGHFDL